MNNLWRREEKKIEWKGINLYLSTLPGLVFRVRSEDSTVISRHINMISSYKRCLPEPRDLSQFGICLKLAVYLLFPLLFAFRTKTSPSRRLRH